ncbi:MAG: hypothetical protein U0694_09155 [Anaerolineae bacterium]
MSANKDLQDKLKQGIDAARNGDRATARKLLQEVIRADPRSELAWMWLASTTDNVAERRACLTKALEINPNNTRAKEALDKLGADAARAAQDKQKVDELRRIQRGQSSTAAPPALPGTPEEGGGGFNLAYIVIAVLVVLGIGSAIVAAVAFSQQPQQPPAQTQISLGDIQSTAEASLLAPTATETLPPTAFGIVVDSVEGIPTLPPTFTPTFTPTATQTPVPSPTPFPLSAFTLLYTNAEAGLYQASGDGSGAQALGEGFADVAYSVDGSMIAFVRDVTYSEDEGGGTYPELFVASLSDLENAQQLTTLKGPHTGHPSWAPDNIQLVFSSDPNGGDSELFVMTEDGNNIRAITDNEAQDIDPSWSPTGDVIAFASDINSPDSTEIFTMSLTGENLLQLTDNEGSSYSPQWSWDGTHIVFASDRSGDSDIYTMEANGDGEFLLTSSDENAEDRAPVFSSSGTSVVFISNRQDERFQLYAVDLRGNEVTRLAQADGDVQSVSYQPNIRFRLSQ